jgi:hypothetical protein
MSRNTLALKLQIWIYIKPDSHIIIDEYSKLNEPILRSSIEVAKQLSLNASFLCYLSAQLD